MALPSQIARTDTRRSHMYRRSRGRRLPVMVIAATVLVGAGWLVVSTMFGGDDDDAGTSTIGAIAPGNGAPIHGAGDAGDVGKGSDTNHDAGNESGDTGADERHADRGSTEAAAGPPMPPGGGTPNDPLDGEFTDELDSSSAGGGDNSGEPTVEQMQRARQSVMYGFQIAQTNPLEARRHFTTALLSNAVTDDDIWKMHIALKPINDKLLFSATIHPEDPFVRAHTVKPNESLEKIVKQQSLLVDWRFIRRINGIEEGKEHLLRQGQTIKLVTGPFHAVIFKS